MFGIVIVLVAGFWLIASGFWLPLLIASFLIGGFFVNPLLAILIAGIIWWNYAK